MTELAISDTETTDVPDVVLFTQELVRLRTVNDVERGTAEEPAALLVADLMRSFGWPVEIVEVAPGRPNVIAVVEGGGGPGPTLMFEGHTDVVTEGDPGEWSVDPYGADITAGKLWGRGSADMKSGVAAMIHATRQLQLEGPFPGRIVVAALVDEEGMMIGAKHFAASELAKQVDAAIICEPEEGEVCTSSKGLLRLNVHLNGVMAHGAMPHQGRNPILPLGSLITGLAELEAEVHDGFGEHGRLGRFYVTPTVVLAGRTEQANVIPSTASMIVDVRTIPGIDHATLIGRITELAADAGRAGGITTRLEIIDDRPPVEIPDDHPIAMALVRAHETVTGKTPEYGAVPGTTDGTILFRDASIPTVVYGPGGKWIAHQANEFVEVDDILVCTQVYVEAARRFLADA